MKGEHWSCSTKWWGAQAVTYPELVCPPPQENPHLWNKFADGKLLFQNTRLLSVVCGNKDRMVGVLAPAGHLPHGDSAGERQ